MNELYLAKSPRSVLSFKDPFSDMMIKANKSPILKPICVKKSQKKIKRFPSETNKPIFLPPLNLRKINKYSLEIPLVGRSSNATPTYLSTFRFREQKESSEIKIFKLT